MKTGDAWARWRKGLNWFIRRYKSTSSSWARWWSRCCRGRCTGKSSLNSLLNSLGKKGAKWRPLLRIWRLKLRNLRGNIRISFFKLSLSIRSRSRKWRNSILNSEKRMKKDSNRFWKCKGKSWPSNMTNKKMLRTPSKLFWTNLSFQKMKKES